MSLEFVVHLGATGDVVLLARDRTDRVNELPKQFIVFGLDRFGRSYLDLSDAY